MTTRKRQQHAERRDDDARRLRCVKEMLPALMDSLPLPRVRLTDSAGSDVITCLPGGPVLRASRRAIDGDSEAWRGELAHEAAHLRDHRRCIETTIALGVYLPLGLVGVAALLQPWQAGEHVPLLTVAVGRLIGLLLLCTAIAAMRHMSHHRELRADAKGAQILGDVKPLLAMLDQVDSDSQQLSRGQRLFSALTHPTPARRRDALLHLVRMDAEVAGWPSAFVVVAG